MGNFRNELMKRDGACLVCWNDSFVARHIVKRDKAEEFGIEYDSLKNGLILCPNCSGRFRQYMYIEAVNNKYVAKIIEEGSEISDSIKKTRSRNKEFSAKFDSNDLVVHVNDLDKKALIFHKNSLTDNVRKMQKMKNYAGNTIKSH